MDPDNAKECVNQNDHGDTSSIKAEPLDVPDAPDENGSKGDSLENVLKPDRSIHKRRASTILATETTESTVDSASAPESNKRSRFDEGDVKKSPRGVPSPAPSTHGYGALPLHRAPGSSAQSYSNDRSFSGSSTSSRASRIVLINTPVKTPASNFSVFNALLSHTDILMQIVRYIPPRNLVYLYSISAPFHFIVNSHYQQFILAATKCFAPNAPWFFPWRCYRELCIDDPALRRADAKREQFLDRKTGKLSGDWKSQSLTAVEAPHSIKPIPSFRWLKMVTYREFVAREIVAWLGVGGHRTPVIATIDAVKKLWFLMDVPLSVPRVLLIHNQAYFSNRTLAVLTMFFIKLDMFFTDPINYTGGEHMVRECLLAEHSLTTMWNWLRGADGTTRLDALRMWVKHSYKRPPRPGPETKETQKILDERAQLPILNIPANMVGRWGYELRGKGDQRLIRPDELVLRESVRRKMDLQKQWLRMVRWGFVGLDLETLPDVKAEDTVLSLMKRKRNQEKAKKEMEEQLKRQQEDVVMDDESDDEDPLHDLAMLAEQIESERA
ncbi:hypothetical protein MBLNU457_g0921t1 [Dothideomycetes sp. NU457]